MVTVVLYSSPIYALPSPIKSICSNILTWTQNKLGLDRIRLVNNESIVQTLGISNQIQLPPVIKVVVWNVHKETSEKFKDEMSVLDGFADLTLLQEVSGYEWVNSKKWSMATSFFQDDIPTGVATGSNVEPIRVIPIRSTRSEPITNTPKMALVSILPMEGAANGILVINIHGLNFVKFSDFKENLLQLRNHISNHDGPVLVAGDFNTSTPMRKRFLNEMLTESGLSAITYENDNRRLRLDHGFVRGLKVGLTSIITNTTTSDHSPLYFEISLD